MRPLAKQLIIIRGPVGAGKTSIVESIRETLGDVSVIDFDAFKRQIDNRRSSHWRREIALDTALYLCQKLMDKGRTIVVDVHASYPEQLTGYLELSKANGYTAMSFLIYPPLEKCIERAKQRVVPDIHYVIDEPMVTQHWNDVFFVDSEKVYDNPDMSTKEIADDIIKSLK